VSALPTRLAFAAGAGVIALIVFGATLWFLGDALMLLLEEHAFRPSAAAGLSGLAGLVLVAALGIGAKLAMRPPRRRAAAPAAAAPRANGVTNGIAADLGALAAQQIVNATREHPYGTVGAALAAGLAMGAIPELRKAALGLFKH
jgi:hypothetical protein